MKKPIFFLILFIAIFSSVRAQIILTHNDLPMSGRVNLLAHDTISQPAVGTASGSAQAWDFTGINISFPQVTSYSSTLPYNQYASTFPEADIYSYGPSLFYGALMGVAPVDYASFGYMYMQSDTSGLSICGYVSQYGITHQVPKDRMLKSPFALNDSFQDSSYWEVLFNNIPANIDTIYRSRTSKTVTADAFGSLTTSFGTFDVLRVRENFIRTDSIFGVISGTTVFSMKVLQDTINNYHFWANNINYPIAIIKTDNNGHVLISEILLDTLPNYQVTGTVYETDGITPVQAGTVQLVPQTTIDNLFGVQEEVNIDNNGHFQFTNVLQFGNFLFVAIPEATQYPNLVPTYFGDTVYWVNATPVQTTTDTAISIACRNNTVWQNYPGNNNSITGIVWQNTGTNKGPGNSTPARGIRVTLEKNPGGIIVRHTETDINGRYTFDNLPSFEYFTIVDIPGLSMDSTYHYDLTTISSQDFAGYDFYYDSTKIFIYDATSNNALESYQTIQLSVYPNPVNTSAFISIQNNETTIVDYSFDIFDISGKLVSNYSGETQSGFAITSDGLENGMYIYRLILNNNTPYSGKLIIQKN